MKKCMLSIISIMASFVIFSNSYASDATKIITILSETYGVDLDMKDIQSELQNLSSDQLDAIIGHYGYGNFLNSANDLKQREWSPNTWEDALKGLSGGNDERYQELVSDYQKNHPALSSSEVKSGASSEYATDYQQAVDTNQAANVQASYAFNEVNEHLENIKEISDKIEKADNAKAIADLNARLNTEIAYLSVEQIKAISVLNQQIAQSQASNIVDRSVTAQFNEIPDE